MKIQNIWMNRPFSLGAMVLQKLDMSFAVCHMAFKIERKVNYEQVMCKMNTKLIKS